MQQDHRHHIRYPILSNALALVLPEQDAFITLFSNKILDISEGGLAFTYVGNVSWRPTGHLLEIVDQNFHLDKVSVTVISDTQFHAGNEELRRCGVKFNHLTRNQKDKITHFIKKYTFSSNAC